MSAHTRKATAEAAESPESAEAAESPEETAARWLARFGAALESGDVPAVLALCQPGVRWRDVLAFTWDLRTLNAAGVEEMLKGSLEAAGAYGFALALGHTPPRRVTRAGVEAVEAFFEFRTALGRGTGIVRLVPAAGDGPAAGTGHQAWTVFTSLRELDGHPERAGALRPPGDADASKFGGENWLDRRVRQLAYDDRDPEVLIVGGGQCGLALAARLGAMGVDALIVDRGERVGDNWRHRYHSLTLHNAVWLNDLPYLPFPPTWPTYVPKDKLADWFEAYAQSMELNFWTGTSFAGGEYDEEERRWTARLRRSDGTERTLRPRHVVVATGVSGIPHVPSLPGLDAFEGPTPHSSAYTDGSAYEGRNVLVIGTGNSGHDVAQDLHSQGAHVTMMQHGTTTVLSVDPGARMLDEAYLTASTVEDCDLIAASLPYDVQIAGAREQTRRIRELDRELLRGLESVGFGLDFGHDETGHQMKYMRSGGGYYLNVGCSDLLARGSIGLIQREDAERFDRSGLLMRDGTRVEADAVILATGYLSQQEGCRALFGDEVAERVGPVWGYDEEGEVRNMWRRTAQGGLWFMAGNFQMARLYSRCLAIQLKADLAGLTPPA